MSTNFPQKNTDINGTLNEFQKKRIAAINKKLEMNYQLLQDYEEQLDLESDPKKRTKYEFEIRDIKENIGKAEQELIEIHKNPEKLNDESIKNTNDSTNNDLAENKKNEIKVSGNGNYVFQDLKGTSINIGTKNKEEKSETPQKPKTEVLFICSSPKEKNPLDFGAEFRKIKDAKIKGAERDSFNVEIETGVEADELINKLTSKPYPDIIHISMHSSKSEGLYFEDSNKNEKPMTAGELAEIFELFSEIHKPKIVILSACNSMKHADAIKPYAECVVGTTDFLPDKVAIIYANRFYEMLFDGKDIEFAHKAARLSIKQASIPEEDKNSLKTPLHEIPVLLT